MARKQEVNWGNAAKNLLECGKYITGFGLIALAVAVGLPRILPVEVPLHIVVSVIIAGMGWGLATWFDTATWRPILNSNNK